LCAGFDIGAIIMAALVEPVLSSIFDFVQKNLLLFAVAVSSGAMLLWPLVRRAGGGPSIGTAQATQLINRQDALVLDVRDAGEYDGGHILGAKNLPLARAESGAGDVAKKKDATLILYCDSGDRATRAAGALRKQGYTKVFTLSGGIGAWKQAGLPVER
jgi:rhodanese-related sulfurtransferase